ncbi:MAG: chitobiase/beta-hexosaminidase C-terminal domain-containing protein [Lachnospiraceae bacterium]|nr:chitobiase/beta-hexosaminidase C-terminal domain-containing protein [Lachnospiraceae bacterium]
MICPSCKREIEEGKLLCEYCGAEIHIVPEFDSRVEESIEETMHAITDDLSKEEARERRRMELKERLIRERRKAFLVLTGVVLGVAIAGAFFLHQYVSYRHSEGYYVGAAYKSAALGKYHEASDFVQKALGLQSGNEISLLLLKEQYDSLNGDEGAVLSAIREVGENDAHTAQELVTAYSHYVLLCESKGEYEKISDFLLETGDELLLSRYRDYVADVVSFDTPGGNYEGAIHVSIRSHYGEDVYYRIDSPSHTGEETLYTEPILLENGEYTITAYTRNRFHVDSDELSETYTVSKNRPGIPVIYPPSGTYHEETEIRVEEEEGTAGKLYYTTDGSDPTLESHLYEGPFSMPAGTSYYRFAYISPEGESGEIVEASYILSEGTSFTEEDGRQSILLSLLQKGEIADTLGTIPGLEAAFSYQYLGLHEIKDRGSFFLYQESIIDRGGAVALTGRQFAVNANSGAVYLYNEPSPGDYVLVPTA